MFYNVKKWMIKRKRGIAFGMVVLMVVVMVTPYLNAFNIAAFDDMEATTEDYETVYLKGFSYYDNQVQGVSLLRLKDVKGIKNKIVICLQGDKKYDKDQIGTITEYSYVTGNFPKFISKDGAEAIGYAFEFAGLTNGRNATDSYKYSVCQLLCWMVGFRGDKFTWKDLNEWKVNAEETKIYRNEGQLSDNEKFDSTIIDYIDYVERRIRPEAIPSYMSKYPKDAPKIELEYNEKVGIWETKIELINEQKVDDKFSDAVWMQTCLDYATVPKRAGLEGKLTLEKVKEGNSNWLYVKFNGDIKELEDAGPISIQFKKDAYKEFSRLETLKIWKHNNEEDAYQHLLVDVTSSIWQVFMRFGGPKPPSPTGWYQVNVDTYQHDETFVSNYNVDLYKYDFETGKPLENAEFEILERMDTSQFNDNVNHPGGKPNKDFPLDDLSIDKFKKIRANTKKPGNDWQVCGTYTTDADGHISHKDTFQYDFSATYCGGHPLLKPEWTDPDKDPVPNPDPDIRYPEKPRTPEELDPTAHKEWKEECKKLKNAANTAREKAIKECEARTNFHSVNPGEAKAALEAYRDKVWNAFINLDYQYTAREKTARTGYILHDLHVDDNPVETVVLNSSEANKYGGYATATGKSKWNNQKLINRNLKEKTQTSLSIEKNDIPVLKSSNPKPLNKYEGLKLEDRKNSQETLPDNEENQVEEVPVASPSDAVLSFEAIGVDDTVSLPYLDYGHDYNEHCTWNGIRWKFKGDPELPFRKSEIPKINQDSYNHNLSAHVFRVYDHRTEGEIHINKRDLDLADNQNDNYSAYADANGDGTLEGAVYGLFAAEDIIHPDGKTGAVFSAGELVSIAATDRNGDASFMAITEESKTSKAKSNLYTQDTTTQRINHGINIDERTYQNNQLNNGNGWIGRPLLLGRYYVKELSRSEGYELSVTGMNQTITNLGASKDKKFKSTGAARFSGYKPDELYGENQDQMLRFDITSADTESYDITISGYPEHTRFYKETEKTVTKKEERTESNTEITKTPILAKAGELMLDENGAKVPLLDDSGKQVYGTTPKTGVFYPILRNKKYPNETAVISDQTAYDSDDIDVSFLKTEGQSIINQIGYRIPSDPDAMPWITVSVSGETNGEMIENLIKELRKDTFYDSYVIDQVTKEGDACTFIIRYGYLYQNAKAYLNGDMLYIKNTCINELENGSRTPGYYYVKYTPDHYEVSHDAYMIEPKKLKDDIAVYGKKYDLVNLYDPLYQTYEGGEQSYGMMLQTDGSYQYGPMYETKVVEDKELVSYEVKEIELTELQAAYEDGIYTIHKDNSDADSPASDTWTDSYRVILPNEDKELIKQNSMVSPSPDVTAAEAGSYVRYKTLAYRSQHDIYSGDDTRTAPVEVLERPIRQRVKIVKDIYTNKDGTYDNSTYQDNHADNSVDDSGRYQNLKTDWLTNLSKQKIAGQSPSKLPEFRFKAYLKSNLERLYRDENGTVTWLDRNGNLLKPVYQDTDGDGNYDTFVWNKNNETTDFPEADKMDGNRLFSANVQKIYTKVEHNPNSTTTGDIPNNTWADYADPQAGNTRNVGEKRPCNTSLDGKNGEAILSNGALYSYRGKNSNAAQSDKLNQDANTGYTRLLETRVETMKDLKGKTREVEAYNYEKFFAAIAAANLDKWDNDMYASEKNYPGQHWLDTFHERGQKDDTDQVRQFAIDWYLSDEAAKLVENNGYDEDVAKAGSLAYQEEVYDLALKQAIIKARQYLKPFYEYDLDTIYSVEWDSSANGGTDQDTTTLSADILYDKTGTGGEGQPKDGYYYGVSAYLPYGTYVVAEQQPYNARLQDFDNKHYKVDKPKEVILPAIYEAGKHTGVQETLNSEYYYDSSATPEMLADKYKIRFNEEWADNHTDDLRNYVIRAHGCDGDYEIYKYGLDIDRLKGRIDYNGGTYSYDGFSITQDGNDPLKNYYNSPLVDQEREGGNKASHYYADDKNKGVTTGNGSTYAADAIEKRYHYGSISEHAGTADDVLYQSQTAADEKNPSGYYFKDKVKTMTGNQTAYEGGYAPMLIPWSVAEPLEHDNYDITNFTGYADSRFQNTYYSSKLRIEKLDSETGEPILFDDAIFAIYAAARNDDQDGDGEALFYEEDTLITGSKEFLEAMMAENITPNKKGVGGRYSGIAKAGTPVCYEEDQVILSDALGNRTGRFRAYTTNQDVSVRSEKKDQMEYANQNVGYLVTPEPLGAGVYVLVELNPPAGYLRTAPIAIEIYSDKISYYMNGDKNNKVIATIYEDSSR